MQKKKVLEVPFFVNWGGRFFYYKKSNYKVKFILIIPNIDYMNTFLIAFILATIDTIISYKYFLKKFRNKLSTLIILFLISFYLFSILIDFIKSKI